MIHDVDESLRELTRRDVVGKTKTEVSFEAPNREWAGRQSTPTLNLYLYDIREDLARRSVQTEDVRGADGFVSGRRPPARRFKLSYLVTAWTQRAEDEHRLLSAFLSCFARYDALPRDVVQGDLRREGFPLRVTIGLPLPNERSVSDVWTALGGELKPSLDLVVTAPLVAGRERSFGPPVLEEPRIGIFGPVAAESVGGAGTGSGPGGRRPRRRSVEEVVPEAVETVAPPDGTSGRRLTVRTVPSEELAPAPASDA